MESSSFCLVIENVRSAQNIGAMFRTADAFACKEIILTGISATPPNKDILKTALGATASVKWRYLQTAEEAVSLLKAEGHKIFAIEQHENASSLQSFDFKNYSKLAFIVGNEVDGVSQQILAMCDGIIEIPQAGIKKSINVAVAAGIIMWSCFKTKLV